jgi:hypothetical protein
MIKYQNIKIYLPTILMNQIINIYRLATILIASHNTLKKIAKSLHCINNMEKQQVVKKSIRNRDGGAIYQRNELTEMINSETKAHVTNKLDRELGKPLRTKEVARYLGLDEKTVRLYRKELGGISLGRNILFFERRLIDAIQKGTEMDWPSSQKREKEEEIIQNKEGSCGVGSRDETKARRRVGREDRHGLLT